MKVWTIYNNGKGDEQVFSNEQEGMEYAKERSTRAWCVFTADSRNRFECYENGNMTSVARKKVLSKQVEQAILREQEFEMKNARAKSRG